MQSWEDAPWLSSASPAGTNDLFLGERTRAALQQLRSRPRVRAGSGGKLHLASPGVS